MCIFKIENLTVKFNDEIIFSDFNLELTSEKINILSTKKADHFLNIIMGDNDYKITKGSIYVDGVCINHMNAYERANLGIFVSQNEIVKLNIDIKELLNKISLQKEKKNINNLLDEFKINCDNNYDNFKKLEILQLFLLKPSVILIDDLSSNISSKTLNFLIKKITNYIKNNKATLLFTTNDENLISLLKPSSILKLNDK